MTTDVFWYILRYTWYHVMYIYIYIRILWIYHVTSSTRAGWRQKFQILNTYSLWSGAKAMSTGDRHASRALWQWLVNLHQSPNAGIEASSLHSIMRGRFKIPEPLWAYLLQTARNSVLAARQCLICDNKLLAVRTRIWYTDLAAAAQLLCKTQVTKQRNTKNISEMMMPALGSSWLALGDVCAIHCPKGQGSALDRQLATAHRQRGNLYTAKLRSFYNLLHTETFAHSTLLQGGKLCTERSPFAEKHLRWEACAQSKFLNWGNLLTIHYCSLDAAIPIRLTMSSCKRQE